MIESNDNKLKEVFGSLSKAKADISSSSWDMINSQIKKPGFWSSSLYHFNYIYVLCGSLLLSTGIILWNNGTEAKPEIKSSIVIEEDKTNNTSYSSKILDAQKAEPSNKANSNITSTKKEITESVDDGSTENMTNSKQPLNETIANTSRNNTDTIKEIALIADTTNYSDGENTSDFKQTLDENTTQSTVTNENNLVDALGFDQEKDSVKTTTAKPTGKQIIIIEEEKTVIQKDTVRKKKRYQKKHD